MQRALAKLNSNWMKQDIPLAKPSSRSATAAKFAELPFSIASDVIKFYATCAGFEDDQLDDNSLTLWTCDRIIRELHTGRPPFLQFADFLIDSHRFAFRRESEDTSSVWLYYQDTPEDSYRISASVSIFATNYAFDPDGMAVLHDAC